MGAGFDRRSIAESWQQPGPILQRMQRLARELKLTIVLGGMPEHASGAPPYNTAFVLGEEGQLLATYRKVHLFDADVSDGTAYRESQNTSAGAAPQLFSWRGMQVGLSICYDLRFPELYRELRRQGAGLLLVPAAFTAPTGEAHWQVLLRARAIENQCFVLAAAQGGVHPGGRRTYGHSQLVGPWGNVLTEAHTHEQVLVHELDQGELVRVRADMPVEAHRRL